MSPHEHDDDRPDLEAAARLVEESTRRSEQDMRAGRERAKKTLSLAERLQRLREENGFDAFFEDAFGG
jgi:hypothetical protein